MSRQKRAAHTLGDHIEVAFKKHAEVRNASNEVTWLFFFLAEQEKLILAFW
jgi:hypothetical protein